MSKLKLIVLVSLLLAGRPAVSAAQSGVEIGVRTGYAFAAGRTGALSGGTDRDVSDWMYAQWPIWIDAGYRMNPTWYVGGYFQYGFGFVNDEQTGCSNSRWDCSASDTRVGLMARYQFAPQARFAPWVGYGFGYEWEKRSVRLSQVGSTSTDRTTWSGFEFANIQIGADYAIASRFVIAPFISLSFGQFRRRSDSMTDGSSSLSNDDSLATRSIHEWILLGMRAAFTL